MNRNDKLDLKRKEALALLKEWEELLKKDSKEQKGIQENLKNLERKSLKSHEFK